MARIGIFGMGNWGTALAKIWSEDGHTVIGWTIENEVYESLMMESINHKYLPGVEMPNLQATMAHGTYWIVPRSSSSHSLAE